MIIRSVLGNERMNPSVHPSKNPCVGLLLGDRVDEGVFLFPHVRLLVQFEVRVRESRSQNYEPGGNENQSVDPRVPKGNGRKGLESVQAEDLGDEFQNAHEGNKETEGVPAGPKGGGIDVSAPPLDTDVDENHDDGHEQPFDGTNGADESVGDNVCDLEGSPSNRVLAVVGNPVGEIELAGEQFGRERGPNVQDVADPFREGSRQDQDGNGDVEADPLGAALAQNPREVHDGEHEEEPGNNIHDSRREIQRAGGVAESPFHLDVSGIEGDIEVVAKVLSLELLEVIDDRQDVSDDEKYRGNDGWEVAHCGREMRVFVCCFTKCFGCL